MNVTELERLTTETVLVPYAETFPMESEAAEITKTRLRRLVLAAGYTDWRVFAGARKIHFYRIREEKLTPDSMVAAYPGFDELNEAERLLEGRVAYLRPWYTEKYKEADDLLARFHGRLSFEQYYAELLIPHAYYNGLNQLCWSYFVSRFGYTDLEYGKFLEWVNEVCLNAIDSEDYLKWSLNLCYRFFERSPVHYQEGAFERHSVTYFDD